MQVMMHKESIYAPRSSQFCKMKENLKHLSVFYDFQIDEYVTILLLNFQKIKE
jgi:hypothetical protein